MNCDFPHRVSAVSTASKDNFKKQGEDKVELKLKPKIYRFVQTEAFKDPYPFGVLRVGVANVLVQY